MAYIRKTKPREKVAAAWLKDQRRELIAAGMTVRELNVLRWRDVDGAKWAVIAGRIKLTTSWARQIHARARRRLKHPSRAHLLP